MTETEALSGAGDGGGEDAGVAGGVVEFGWVLAVVAVFALSGMFGSEVVEQGRHAATGVFGEGEEALKLGVAVLALSGVGAFVDEAFDASSVGA